MAQLAFSYVRFSSEQQAQGDSLRRQLDAAARYAKENGLTLDTSTYRDLGISAFKGKNLVEGALGAFLQAIDSGRIPAASTLLVESLDRLSREDVQTALELFLSITRRGITIVTLMDSQVYSRDTIKENWTKLIVAMAIMARANEESVTKSSRVKAAYDKKRREGKVITSKGPSWLVLDKDKQEWQIIPEKAKVINQIFDWAIAGWGQVQIVRKLEDLKVPTLVSAQHWAQPLVGAILRNPSVYGLFQQKSGGMSEVQGYYPAIMDKAKFMAARNAVSGRKSKGGIRQAVTNIFSGIAFCAECGARMKYQPTRTGYSYLICLTAYSTKVRCPKSVNIPYKAAELAFVYTYVRHARQRLFDQIESDVDRGQASLKGEIEALKVKQRKVLQLALTLPDVAVVADEMKSVQASISKLEEELRAVGAAPGPITKGEISASLDYFDEYFRLLEGDSQANELNELRRRVKVTLNRQIERVEFGVGHDANDQLMYFTQYEPDGKTSRGIVHLGKFLNERSKAARRRVARSTPSE